MTVEKHGDKIVVVPYLRTTSGYYISGEQLAICPSDVADKSLGDLVKEAFRHTDMDFLPVDSTTLKARFAKHKKAIGVRNMRQYMEQALAVQLLLDADEVLAVSPTRNEGSRGGFAFREHEGRQIKFGDASSSEIGEAVRAVLALSD
ncbi:hypothetical protein F4553_001976 [Allocatelliglobosispora scoriae]|uniref:Uncharacterized protein n=1 Tax=Allocatelliglobosispora scoriae TaxID=643052 RepID=A0A841BHM1_9ACTN|nr:hypothetical protein [Allocatelliglobosispora scoriae]MBB5868597.1 hypothetical protein [Allocatelliglobosispora scoriae]